jgi:hypothetical protein
MSRPLVIGGASLRPSPSAGPGSPAVVLIAELMVVNGRDAGLAKTRSEIKAP